MSNKTKRNKINNSAKHPAGSANRLGEDKQTQHPENSANLSAEKMQAQYYCPYNSDKPVANDENKKIAVYETLRNEIISTQGMRTNLIVYMFSVYFLLFGYGVGNEGSHRLCFVATYAVLLAFQTKIIRSKYTIARISVFIREYYEPKTEEKLYKWETINLENNFYRTNNKVITFFSSTAAFQLGFLSLFAFVISTCKVNCIVNFCPLNILKNICSWSGFDKFSLFVCISCLVVLFLIRDEYKVNKKIIARMQEQFNEIKIINTNNESNVSNGS